ncbi:MAG: OprO/OprP family phosphate-selective porin [Hyphomonadaceae bacterium]
MNSRTSAFVGVGWLALAGLAAAEPAAGGDGRDARIQQLEERLEALQAQIDDLKASTAADAADIRRAASEQPALTLTNGRPAIASSDGGFRFALRGVLQYDVATYLQDNALPAGAVQDLSSGANFRRARLGFEGAAFRDWNYALTYEAGGSGVEAAGLQQAYLEYAGWRPFGLSAPVRLRAGAFAVENTLEGATSNTDSLFLERPSAAEVVRAAFGGDGRNAFGVFGNGGPLSASLVLTGGALSNADVAPANSGAVNDEGWGYVARLAGLALRAPDYSLHLGVNYSALVQLGDSTSGPNTLQLRDRPELRVDSSTTSGAARLIDTGALTASGARAYGLELAGQWKNFYLAGERLTIDVDRPGALRDPFFSGYYVQGAWTLTGERRAWNAASGGYGGVRPANAFDPGQGHWGAWEIAARYSVLDLNDHDGAARSATPAGGVRGGVQAVAALGLNWYPNSVVRFLLNVQNVEIDRLNDTGAQIGQDYQAVALRTQVAF